MTGLRDGGTSQACTRRQAQVSLPYPKSSCVSGYLASLTVKKIFEECGTASFDVEIELSKKWESQSPNTAVSFFGVRDLRIGDPNEGLPLGALVYLSIWDVSADQWEDVRFRVVNDEMDFALSLFCREF